MSDSDTTRIDWRHVASTALGVLAGVVATVGTLAVAVAGFTLSYDAIRKVGIAAGVRPDWAWLLPVSIDGAMAVATVTAVVMSRMGRKAWYPWAVVLAGAGISIACNAVHAKMRHQLHLDDDTAMAVSAIPAVMLALSVHLLVVLVDAAAGTLGHADTGPVTVAATPVTFPTDVTAAVPAIGAAPVPTPDVPAVPAPIGTPTRTRTATAKRARTGTGTGTRTAQKPGTRTDAELTEALAAVPRDDDGTVPVRRAASALGTGPDRARRLLADAGLLRTEPDAEPDTKPVNGHAVPELALTAGVQS